MNIKALLELPKHEFFASVYDNAAALLIEDDDGRVWQRVKNEDTEIKTSPYFERRKSWFKRLLLGTYKRNERIVK